MSQESDDVPVRAGQELLERITAAQAAHAPDGQLLHDLTVAIGNVSEWKARADGFQCLTDVLSRLDLLLEAQLQKEMVDQVNRLCKLVLEEVSDLLKSSVTKETPVVDRLKVLLRVLMSGLSSLSALVSHVVKVCSHDIDHGPLTIVDAALAVTGLLDVVHQTLVHCQESGQTYGELFSAMTGDLVQLFKLTYSTLKTLFPHLEEVSAIGELPLVEIQPKVISLFEMLRNVSEVSIQFDNAFMVKCTRAFIKFVCKFGDLVRDSVKVGSVFRALSGALLARLQLSLQESSDGSFPVNEAKAFCFLANAVTSLAKSFLPSDEESQRALVHMLIGAHLEMPCWSESLASNQQLKVLREALKMLMANVVPELVSSGADITGFIHELVERDAATGLGCLSCVVWLMAHYTEFDESVQACLFQLSASEDRCALLEIVFSAVSCCSVDLLLNSAFSSQHMNGDKQKQFSIYESVLTTVVAFSASLPSQAHFCCVEWTIFRWLLTCADASANVLAGDILCSLARAGQASLRQSYVCFFARLVHALPASRAVGFVNLCSLLRCLLLSLSPGEVQGCLAQLKLLIVDDVPYFWTFVPFSKLPPLFLQQIVPGLFMSISRQLSALTKLSIVQPSQMMLLLEVLVSVCADQRALQVVPMTVRSQLPALALALWKIVLAWQDSARMPTEDTAIAGEHLAVWCVQLTPVLSAEEYFKLVVLYKDRVLPTMKSACVLAALPATISAWGEREIPSQLEGTLLDSMASLCCQLIQHSHWLVHQQALRAFRQFAEVTPYADSVEAFMPGNMTDVVVNYLKQVPCVEECLEGDTSTISVLRERADFLHKEIESRAYSEADHELRQGIVAVDSALLSLRQALDNRKSPTWLVKDLQRVRSSIDQLLNTSEVGDT